MIRLSVTAGVLLLAVAGCAARVPGNPVADEAAAKEAARPLTAQAALGDLATLDYCSLVDKEAFPDSVGLLAVLPKSAYDECTFAFHQDASDVKVSVGFLEDEETLSDTDHALDRRHTLPHGLEVHRGDEGDGSCVRYLNFTDEILLTVTATNFDEPDKDWCAVADATVDVVVDRVLHEKVRHHEFGPKTLARVDACELAPEELVRTRLGATDLLALPYPSGHACTWLQTAATAQLQAHLYFGVSETTYDTVTSTEENLAGHHSYVTADKDEEADIALCMVETNFSGEPRSPVGESAVLEVLVTGKDHDPCPATRELAKEVWAKLPW